MATSSQAELLDRQIHRVRSAATALLRWRDKLPERKKTEYEDTITAWSGGSLSPEILQKASELESRRPNPNYVSGPTLIIATYSLDSPNEEEAIAAFVREWRQHFVDVLRPKYMPVGWSVDAPVQSDKRV